jgi:hypothetical protein
MKSPIGLLPESNYRCFQSSLFPEGDESSVFLVDSQDSDGLQSDTSPSTTGPMLEWKKIASEWFEYTERQVICQDKSTPKKEK